MMDPSNLFNGYVFECDGREARLVSQPTEKKFFQSFLEKSLESRVTDWVKTVFSKKKDRHYLTSLELFHWIHFVSCHSKVFCEDQKRSTLRYLVLTQLDHFSQLFSSGAPAEAERWNRQQIATLDRRRQQLLAEVEREPDDPSTVIDDYMNNKKNVFLLPVESLEGLLKEAQSRHLKVLADSFQLAYWRHLGWSKAVHCLTESNLADSPPMEWLFTQFSQKGLQLRHDLPAIEALSAKRLREYLLFCVKGGEENEKVDLVLRWLFSSISEEEKKKLEWHDCIVWTKVSEKTRRQLLREPKGIFVVDAILESLGKNVSSSISPFRGKLNELGERLCQHLETSDPTRMEAVLDCLNKLGSELVEIRCARPQHFINLREMTYRATWLKTISRKQYDQLIECVSKIAHSIIRSLALKDKSVAVIKTKISALERELKERGNTVALVTIPSLQDRYERREQGDCTLHFKGGDLKMFSDRLPEELRVVPNWEERLKEFDLSVGKDFIRFCHQFKCKDDPLALALLLQCLEILDDAACVKLLTALPHNCDATTKALLMMRAHPVGTLDKNVYKDLRMDKITFDLLPEPWFKELRRVLYSVDQPRKKFLETIKYAKVLYPEQEEEQIRYVQAYAHELLWTEYSNQFTQVCKYQRAYLDDDLVFKVKRAFLIEALKKPRVHCAEGVTLVQSYGRQRQSYERDPFRECSFEVGKKKITITWGFLERGTCYISAKGRMPPGTLVITINSMEFAVKLDERERMCASNKATPEILKLEGTFSTYPRVISIALHEDG